MNKLSIFTGAVFAAATLLATAASSAPLSLSHHMMRGDQRAPVQEETERGYETPAQFRRQVVAYNGSEAAGTVIIDTPNTHLYFVMGNGRAIRYGIVVGRDDFRLSGV